MASCGPSPPRLLERLEQQLQARDWTALARHLDDNYADPLGDRATVLQDLQNLEERFPRWEISLNRDEAGLETSALVGRAETRLTLDLAGKPYWKVQGLMELELRRTDQWRVVSGLLTDLRDIQGLMQRRRAALEGNAPDRMAELLHPRYRDGLIDRAEAIGRLRTDLSGVAVRISVTNYRLDIRRDLAHIDEYFRMTVDGRPIRPSKAGLTLKKLAGRWLIAGGLYRSQ